MGMTAQRVYFASHCLTVPGQGMPLKNSPRRGPLHVVLNVKWPTAEDISEETIKALKFALPKSVLPVPKFTLESGECDIADMEPFRQAEENRRTQHDEDSD